MPIVVGIIGFFVVILLLCILSLASEEEDERQRQRRNSDPAYRILYTEILGTGTQETGSSLGRAFIGGMLDGTRGAIIGALSTPSASVVQFLVVYEDGHRNIETVKMGSMRMDTLLSHMR